MTQTPGPGTCKACRAAILWITTEAGKSMPCDPDPLSIVPSEVGSTVVVTAEGKTIRGHAHHLIDSKKTEGAIEGFTSHFATCPAASSFRRRNDK